MFGKRKRRTNVHVFGAGPAGLVVALAAREAGHSVTIFTKADANGYPLKSELHGCQYLHAELPLLGMGPEHQTLVRYLLDGPAEGYRQKVYGNAWNGTVSPDEYGPEEDHRAYDLRVAYHQLWDMFQHDIYPTTLNAHSLQGILPHRWATTISTVPAPELCGRPDQHTFASTDIWAMGSRVKLRQDPTHGAPPGFIPSGMPFRAPESTVMCNGHRDTRWYRAATVFGHSTLEWPDGARPPITGVVRVRKPLSTDCDCWQAEGLLRLGRYGEWRKGVLVHEVYQRAKELLS